MLITEIQDSASLITARLFLAIKPDEDQEERYKVRYVAIGHLHIMKDYLVHGEQTIQCVSVGIILVDAKIRCFHIRVVDVKLIHFQSERPLIMNIFITNPAPEFELSPEEFLELLCLVYSLADSGD